MAKLFFTPNSPYARKCRVVIIEKGLEKKVEMVQLDPATLFGSSSPAELLVVTPLGTVPALVTDEGLNLCESPVICEYLDSLSAQNPLYPSKPAARFPVLALAALADGIMDAAVAAVLEARRPEGNRSPDWIVRKEAAVTRSLNLLGAHAVSEEDSLTIGTIALAVALGYVSFRLPHIDWKKSNPELASWYERMAKRPSMAATAPVAA